ncbi:MAG: hypothetical protein IZT57_00005 [Chloroflexi bacterium]|nr:hypothetical protein [Chloroflexota bacterium]
MKRYFLYIIGAFFAEIMIIMLATMFNLSGFSLLVFVGFLPASLFVAAIIYLMSTFIRGTKAEVNRDNESTK